MYKVNLVWDDGSKQEFYKLTEDECEVMCNGMRTALGSQIKYIGYNKMFCWTREQELMAMVNGK